MYHVYSTMANDNEYIRYSEHGPRGINVAERSVVIKGGSGINQRYLRTPLGVHTAAEDEDMEWLKDNYSFKQHVSNGYIRFEKRKVDPEVAAADMATRQWVKDATGNLVKGDAFPVSPQDFRDDDKKETVKPMVNKKSKAA